MAEKNRNECSANKCSEIKGCFQVIALTKRKYDTQERVPWSGIWFLRLASCIVSRQLRSHLLGQAVCDPVYKKNKISLSFSRESKENVWGIVKGPIRSKATVIVYHEKPIFAIFWVIVYQTVRTVQNSNDQPIWIDCALKNGNNNYNNNTVNKSGSRPWPHPPHNSSYFFGQKFDYYSFQINYFFLLGEQFAQKRSKSLAN